MKLNLLDEWTIFHGKYSYQFSRNLPISIPSSIEALYGHIRYKVKVIVDTQKRMRPEFQEYFNVIKPYDLTVNPRLRVMIFNTKFNNKIHHFSYAFCILASCFERKIPINSSLCLLVLCSCTNSYVGSHSKHRVHTRWTYSYWMQSRQSKQSKYSLKSSDSSGELEYKQELAPNLHSANY